MGRNFNEFMKYGMKALNLPSMERFMVQKTKHQTESAEVCEEIERVVGKKCYWMQYKYHPDRMRRALKAYQVANRPDFKNNEHKWRYFLAILKNTI